ECSGDRSGASAEVARSRSKAYRAKRTPNISAQLRVAFGKRPMAARIGRPFSTRKTFRQSARLRWHRQIITEYTQTPVKRPFAATPLTELASINRSTQAKPGKISG